MRFTVSEKTVVGLIGWRRAVTWVEKAIGPICVPGGSGVTALT
jgi:hypothetical protein